ncbi:hypothetical protein PIB30_051183 [Stylosanthes scabra]|uniref:Uncharacterized protein n=1 Tax=Stylosanthes scabra TaxID=79078 RepID=A0ABU6VGR4_9FABA|nr:hypothetical protein [Stylosanthes scabra]
MMCPYCDSGEGSDSPTTRCPARGRRARMQRPDIRWKGEGASTSGRSHTQPGGDHVDEEAEYRRHEDILERAGAQDRGDGHAPHEPDVDFFSGAARFILLGEGSGLGSAPHLPSGRPSGQFSRYGPPNDMYDVFSCVPALAAVVPSAFTAAAVSAALALFPAVLPVVTAAGLSVAFIGSATLPAPVQLSDTVAPATTLSECGIAFAPPAAARRSILPLSAGAIGPPDCPPTGTAATEGSPSTPMRQIIPSPPSPSARGQPGLSSETFLI